ncbi:MAG TPA: MotA/TolQ/ExbB proton channel family protein [Aliidongia sp.]|uniref:motility protein A n=1 Tax=Aliidongia sp. TaxID=1914230 RepID=UPI002DDD28A9|nr:MotA/TolQ/ExbB proton channel family protein [Aliidongia sp.]HEV2674057.1 MotA/TolQ/ExbB proton channel family protein [Aliidongia sp.]
MTVNDLERDIKVEAPPSRILPDPIGGTRDGATLFGLGLGLALLVFAMLLGGSLAAYVDFPAFMMVVGGTLAVTTISFGFDDLKRLPSALATATIRRVPAAHHAASRLVALAEASRRQGFLALEDLLPKLKDDWFLIKALALVIDNTPPDEIERQLRAELSAMLARHRVGGDMLRRAGEVAPAMGLIGTLVGLVQMLSNLNNPTTIGPAMAVAILATLYGAVLANMVLLPLAAKLDRNNHAEALVHNLTILAANAIARQESPRRLEVMLNGILPPAERISYFD